MLEVPTDSRQAEKRASLAGWTDASLEARRARKISYSATFSVTESHNICACTNN